MSATTAAAKIIEQIQMLAQALDCYFTFKGEAIQIDRALAANGLLPGLMRRADQLCSFCFGYGLGVTFERSDSSMMGVTVEFNLETPAAIRLLCALDVLIEIMQAAPNKQATPIDTLMMY